MLDFFLYLFFVLHCTTLVCTLYVHRGKAHNSIKFHPFLEHVMRLWQWLSSGMLTREWIAVHKLHHHKCESFLDPHSPVVHGFFKAVMVGVIPYCRVAIGFSSLKENETNKNFIDSYGTGTPDDWIERNLYTPYSYLGILLMLIVHTWIFGIWGLVIWILQLLWTPFLAAFMVNGFAHSIGYRNHDTNDNSRNLFPLGILLAGEELHNNHHNDPGSAKLSHKPWEFDLGWMWLKLFQRLGLAHPIKS